MKVKILTIIGSILFIGLVGTNLYLYQHSNNTKIEVKQEQKNEDNKETNAIQETTKQSEQVITTTEKETDSIQKIEEQVTSFLRAFTTYTAYGENYATYEPFLDPTIRDQAKTTLDSEQSKINTAGVGRSTYKQCELYVSTNQEVVIATTETHVVINGVSKQTTLTHKLTLRYDEQSNTYYIVKIQAITFME